MTATTLLTGKEVFELIDTADFIKNWKELADTSPGFNRLQEPEFVTTWYEFYNSEYDPVFSVVFGEDHKPLALMCLAWQRSRRVLTHAGHDNAEYFGWLAAPELNTKFLIDTVQLVRKHFDIKTWTWRWLAPGISPAPFRNLAAINVYASVENRPSQIWNLNDPEKLSNLKKSKSIKYQIKRLQRKGELKFRVITDEEETFQLLETVKYQYDFRQEAINSVRPFADNPQKVAFNAALQKYPGTYHMSGLWLNDKLLAFHLGICDKKRVCLGTLSFDPTESKYSPGTLLIISLAEELTLQGFQILDLTPGTDAYKERFANEQETVFRPTISISPLAKLTGRTKSSIFEVVRKILPVFKIDIRTVVTHKNYLKNLFRSFRQLSLFQMAHLARKRIIDIQHLYIYRCDFDTKPGFNYQGPINLQKYSDLMSYKDQQPWLTRRDLLQEAMSKFNNGETLYSLMQNDELNWLGWRTDSVNTIKVRGFPGSIDLVENQSVFYDFYYPRHLNRDHFFTYLEQSLIQLSKVDGVPVMILLDSRFKLSPQKVNEWRIDNCKELVCVRLFWFLKFFHEKNHILSVKPL